LGSPAVQRTGATLTGSDPTDSIIRQTGPAINENVGDRHFPIIMIAGVVLWNPIFRQPRSTWSPIGDID
jgi:hypothetical protein